MTTTALCPQPVEPGSRATTELSSPRRLFTDLERFWPSRRGHAFDEFCR